MHANELIETYLLNEYRKPKSAYHAVRQCYLEFARAESETNGKGEMKP